MAKSLDQFEYEMQHQRFLKVLSEALYEIQDDPEPTRCDTPTCRASTTCSRVCSCWTPGQPSAPRGTARGGRRRRTGTRG